MKLPILILTIVSALLMSTTIWADSPLEKEMSQINRNMRKLSRQYADPAQKAASLELIAAIQKSVTASKTLTPSKAEKLPGAEKAKYLDTYKKDLDALETEITALKEAITADKADVAKTEMEKIAGLKSSSHKELGVGGRKGPPTQGAAQPSPAPTP